jgi:hypothetical protein
VRVSAKRCPCGLLQDIQMHSQDLLQDLAQIFEHMPAIEHLLGQWSPDARLL